MNDYCPPCPRGGGFFVPALGDEHLAAAGSVYAKVLEVSQV